MLIVTDGNMILHAFFDTDAVQKIASITYIKTAELKEEATYRRPAQAGAYDLVVFDRCHPEDVKAMPLANTYFIDDVPPPWKRSELPDLKDTRILKATSKDPLMDGVTGLDKITVFEAFRFELDPAKNPGVPSHVHPLLEIAGGEGVLFALPRGAYTDLVQTFPLIAADGTPATEWWKRVDFVKFLRNVLYQLGAVSDAAAEERAAARRDQGDPAGSRRKGRWSGGRASPGGPGLGRGGAGLVRRHARRVQELSGRSDGSHRSLPGDVGGRPARLRGRSPR